MSKNSKPEKLNLGDLVLYPDEYDFINGEQRMVPVVMIDGIPAH
jgi:hypothetical protein